MPQPVSAREGDLTGSPACGPVLRGYSGGNWMVVVAPPVRRGRSARPGDLVSPLLDSPTYTPPLRGLVGPARSAPFARWPAARAPIRALQLLLFNEECLVGTSHQLVPITSLPFVHTARRYYRLNGSVRPSDWLRGVGNDSPEPESEPAEGSLPSEGPLGPTSHPCLSYLVASAGPPFRRPPGRPRAPGPAPAEDPNMNAVLKNSVNHRVFERTLRPLVFRGACLSERHCCPQARLVCWAPSPPPGTGPKGSGGTASDPRAYGALSPAL
ncbi:hypothetical protein CNMCM8980_006931 [Aspergillus fumigatiaffinis]|nr:hypothetical protein CNMCM8980_006931 [Aspergillus fumigatiaffinis]